MDDLYTNMFIWLEEFAKKSDKWSDDRKRRAAETIRVNDKLLEGN